MCTHAWDDCTRCLWPTIAHLSCHFILSLWDRIEVCWQGCPYWNFLGKNSNFLENQGWWFVSWLLTWRQLSPIVLDLKIKASNFSMSVLSKIAVKCLFWTFSLHLRKCKKINKIKSWAVIWHIFNRLHKLVKKTDSFITLLMI